MVFSSPGNAARTAAATALIFTPFLEATTTDSGRDSCGSARGTVCREAADVKEWGCDAGAVGVGSPAVAVRHALSQVLWHCLHAPIVITALRQGDECGGSPWL